MDLLKVGRMRYVEKHRIYGMFGNVIKALIMCQPRDPLRFILWYLKHQRYMDVLKIMLVAPPWLGSDKEHIALNIAKTIGVVIVERRNVINRHRKKQKNGECTTDFMTMLLEYMRAKGVVKKGWLLLDIPNSNKETEKLINIGILPTHTILLNVNVSNENQKIFRKFNQYYRELEFEIKLKFQSTLKELCVSNKSIEEITELCLDNIFYRKPSAAPFIPRVVLIGPKGSRRFVTASVICKKLNLVHVDFNQVLVQKNIDDTKEITEETMHSWVKEKITEIDCVQKGYMLTGFPRTRNDLQWLDSIEMSPNRVIFLAIDFREIYARLRNRCVNENTGTFMTLDQAVNELKAGRLKFENLNQYPLNLEKLLCDFKTYCDHLKEMLYYCGNDCYIVTADDESVCKKILTCIMSASPTSGPRPQNHKPSRLTKVLNEKMLLSYNDDICRNVQLSEEAQNLLNDLKRKPRKEGWYFRESHPEENDRKLVVPIDSIPHSTPFIGMERNKTHSREGVRSVTVSHYPSRVKSH